MNTLYVEPFSGLSGDMFLGALAGLTDSYEDLVDLPGKMHLPDGKIVVHEVNKNGILCKHVKVIDLNEAKSEHAHSHDGHHHDHGDDAHSHSYEASDHHHPHRAHRHLSDILHLIEHAHIPAGAKAIATEIFQLIGQAESTIHNIPIEQIHFHEISGVDSLLDIVGCAVLLDKLKISKTFSDPICTGYGMVKTQHGLLPIPAPATAELLKGLPVFKGNEEGERVTPTGAAILRYLRPDFHPPAMTLSKIAYGPGQKDFTGPNVLRLSLVKVQADLKDALHVVETQLDDCPGELLGQHFQEGLIRTGAIDFTLSSVIMKKGRPGFLLSCLTGQDNLDAVCDFILEQTPTVGVRHYPVSRKILSREIITLKGRHGGVSAKKVITPTGNIRIKAEFEGLKKLSIETGIPIVQLKAEYESVEAHTDPATE